MVAISKVYYPLSCIRRFVKIDKMMQLKTNHSRSPQHSVARNMTQIAVDSILKVHNFISSLNVLFRTEGYSSSL